MFTMSEMDILLSFVRDLTSFSKRCVPRMTLQRTHHGNDPMDGIGGTIKNQDVSIDFRPTEK